MNNEEYALLIIEQGKRINELEKLLREWKKYGESSWESMHPHALIRLTDQLLKKEEPAE